MYGLWGGLLGNSAVVVGVVENVGPGSVVSALCYCGLGMGCVEICACAGMYEALCCGTSRCWVWDGCVLGHLLALLRVDGKQGGRWRG